MFSPVVLSDLIFMKQFKFFFVEVSFFHTASAAQRILVEKCTIIYPLAFQLCILVQVFPAQNYAI